jgi:hypothetical protein
VSCDLLLLRDSCSKRTGPVLLAERAYCIRLWSTEYTGLEQVECLRPVILHVYSLLYRRGVQGVHVRPCNWGSIARSDQARPSHDWIRHAYGYLPCLERQELASQQQQQQRAGSWRRRSRRDGSALARPADPRVCVETRRRGGQRSLCWH